MERLEAAFERQPRDAALVEERLGLLAPHLRDLPRAQPGAAARQAGSARSSHGGGAAAGGRAELLWRGWRRQLALRYMCKIQGSPGYDCTARDRDSNCNIVLHARSLLPAAYAVNDSLNRA